MGEKRDSEDGVDPSDPPDGTAALAAPFTPDKRWTVAFVAQATNVLRRQAMNFARHRVRMIEQSGGRVDSSHAEDLVQDVLGDTWRGVLAWKPDEVSLLTHVNFAVRSRTRHDREHAEKFPHVPLALPDEEDEGAPSVMNEAEEALAATALEAAPEERFLGVKVFSQLRALAAGDRELLAVLEAMRGGAVDRADLMRVTGMPGRTYENVRRRLDRLVEELPQRLVRSVTESGATPARRSEQSAA